MRPTEKKSYSPPTLEVIRMDARDIITTSGPFAGDWDENLPQAEGVDAL